MGDLKRDREYWRQAYNSAAEAAHLLHLKNERLRKALERIRRFAEACSPEHDGDHRLFMCLRYAREALEASDE